MIVLCGIGVVVGEAAAQQGSIDLDPRQRLGITEELLFTFSFLNKTGKQEQKESDAGDKQAAENEVREGGMCVCTLQIMRAILCI